MLRLTIFEFPLRCFTGLLAIISATQAFAAGANGFVEQIITLPAPAMVSQFADLDGNGRSDLLAVDGVSKRLLIYRQRTWGFTNASDQVMDLPPRTAWIAPYAVENHKASELVMSTATGVIYYRQNGGVFETGPHMLIKAGQVFTNDDSPRLTRIISNSIPVISATTASVYRRNEALQWTSGPPAALEARRDSWYADYEAWSLNEDPARTLEISRFIHSNAAETNGTEKPENEAIAKMITELEKSGPRPRTMQMDVNGDGRKDLVVWQAFYDLAPKTHIFVFLRGADGKLPEQPSQILHCRGYPIPIGSTRVPAPVGDLKGDGTCELVLVEPRLMLGSVGGMVDMALSRGVEMALTIRTFNHGAFSRSADVSVPFTSLLSWYGTAQWSFFVLGDFNGDGRPDFVAQRSSSEWDIYPSTDDGRWFKAQPVMSFQMPTDGYFERRNFEITDLNGDGRADIVLRNIDDPRIVIFLTQSQP